jgi:predicted permease
MRLFQKFRALFRRSDLDREMAEEMQAHVDLQVQANLAAGMTPAEAQGAARRQFGHLDGLKEAARDQRRFRWVEDIAQDLRYGWRQLRKNPGFTAAVVLTLGVGIGACTVIFAAADSMLLRPFAYPESDRLVIIRELRPPNASDFSVSAGDYFEWRKQASVFENLAVAYSAAYNLSGAGEPSRVDAQRVTANYFSTLRVHPFLGRDFRPEEDEAGQGNVVILSHGYWLRQFAGRADAVNQTIQLDGQTFTIIGVMPADFRQFQGYQAQIWTPAAFSGAARQNRGSRFINEVVGRLKPGVTLEQARSELAVIVGRLAKQFPETNEGWSARLRSLQDYSVQYLRAPTLGLLGAVGFLLLIGCANVANLLLAKGTTRQRELAIRAAVGASRGRVVRQLLVESLLLAACGGGLGLLLSFWGVQAAFVSSGLTPFNSIAVDGRVAGFACALTVITSVIFGILPAWRASRTSPIDAIKGGQPGAGPAGSSRRLLGFLVVAEIALALVLLAGTGLMMREFMRVLRLGPGFELRDGQVMELSLAGENYAAAPQRNAFINEVLDRIAGLPGVTAVGVTDVLPLSGNGSIPGFSIPGRPPVSARERPSAFAYRVSPDYFKAMGIVLRQGRVPVASDGPGTPVAVINDVLAERFFPGENPVGQRIELDGAAREIVGVVGGVKHYTLAEAVQPQIYTPLAHRPTNRLYFVVRFDRAVVGDSLPGSLRAVVQAVNPNQPIALLSSLDDFVAARMSGQRLALALFATFSLAALLLAGIGIYGVMAYSVAQRTGEIGLRMALGAEHRDVLRLVATQGGRLIGFGLAAGLIGTLALSRLIQSVLQSLFAGAGTNDPVVFAGVALLLGLVGLIACLVPARRAARIDPVIALRAE